jgi:RNA-directed DNA polymerase
VKANKGSSGIDGMKVAELPGYLKQHWPAIREQVLSGTYQPQPVRRVEIAKPDGGMRKLGIPTVLDRFMQPAVMQVLQGRWDRTFSEHSHGFRPQRSAQQGVAKAQQYIAKGNRWVVELDLEKFFDRVNPDKLRAAVARRGATRDAQVDPSIPESGDGERAGESGGRRNPPGGPLSPLLSNLVLDELDRELERRYIARATRRIAHLGGERAGGKASHAKRQFHPAPAQAEGE